MVPLPDGLSASMQQHSTFLARLPRLATLTILLSSKALLTAESSMREALKLFGAASDGRVTALTVSTPSLSHFTSRVIHQGYPQLQTLVVSGAPGPGDDYCMTPGHIERGCRVNLRGQMFKPLEGALLLTKLKVGRGVEISGDALASIGGLTRLQDLDLQLDGGDACGPAQVPLSLQSWTRLVSLTRCRLARADHAPVASVVGASSLFSLTRLTHLEVTSLDNNDDGREPPAAMAAAFALLGGMHRLGSLHLGREFILDLVALAALAPLTQLTSLGVGCMELPDSQAGGHLAALQRLRIEAPIGPTELLMCLRPLLPLPALTHLQPEGGDDGGSLLQLGDFGQALVGARVTALRLVSEHLNHALILLLHKVAFISLPCTVDQIVWALEPLARRITCLEFFHECFLTDAEVAAVAWGFPALQRLSLRDSAAATVSDAGWVGVAAAVAGTLALDVRPRLSAGRVARCRAEGERVLGRWNITFV